MENSDVKLSYYERNKEKIIERNKARYRRLKAEGKIVSQKKVRPDPRIKRLAKSKKYYKDHKDDLLNRAKIKYVPKPKKKKVADLLKEIEELVNQVKGRLPKGVIEGYRRKPKKVVDDKNEKDEKIKMV